MDEKRLTEIEALIARIEHMAPPDGLLAYHIEVRPSVVDLVAEVRRLRLELEVDRGTDR